MTGYRPLNAARRRSLIFAAALCFGLTASAQQAIFAAVARAGVLRRPVAAEASDQARSSSVPDKCRPRSASGYVKTVVCHLKVVGSLNRRINRSCARWLSPGCSAAIRAYRTQLKQVKADLAKVKVPPLLKGVNGMLHHALDLDLKAAGLALTAIRNRDFPEFLSATAKHNAAGHTLLLVAAKLGA